MGQKGEIFVLTHTEQKLKAQDPNVVVVPNVETFGDCYRACVNSDETKCRTLSYCSTGQSSECLVTGIASINASIDEKIYSECSTFSKNDLLDYSVIQNRRFKVPASISQELWPSQCASKCSSDEDCYSFQTCGQTCILSGHYTDSSTEYDDDCEIHIRK